MKNKELPLHMYYLRVKRSTEFSVYNVYMKKVVIKNLEEMDACAKEFLAHFTPKDSACVIGLSGDLGAGKTAFVKSVAKVFGITDHITSPTFVLQKTYPILPSPKLPVPTLHSLVHIDAYRFESADELTKIGWAETIKEPGALVLIEWPERVEKVLPPTTQILHFDYVDDTTREVTFPDTW